MYLTGLTQRERIFEMAMRWLRGHLEVDDGRFLTLAFLLDPVITAPVVNGFLRDVTAPMDPPLRPCPEPFPQAMPLDAFAIDGLRGDLRAIIRFKSILRLADQVARRATAQITPEIRSRAAALTAQMPATGAGPGDGALAEAERLVSHDLAAGVLTFDRRDLLIGDLIGARLIGEQRALQRLEAEVASHPQVVSVRRAKNRAHGTETRLEVELACPAPAQTVKRLLAREWPAVSRGMAQGDLRRAVPRYVNDGRRTFFIELVLTTAEDPVGSEFSRGLPEERTVGQGDDQGWARRLGTNVALSMAAMLLVAVAPTVEVDEVPIKLSGSYLPDGLAAILGRLFDLEIDCSPLWLSPTMDRRGDDRTTPDSAARSWAR